MRPSQETVCHLSALVTVHFFMSHCRALCFSLSVSVTVSLSVKDPHAGGIQPEVTTAAESGPPPALSEAEVSYSLFLVLLVLLNFL